MTKREQKIEILHETQDAMIWLTMGDTGKMSKPIRHLLYVLCKGVYMLFEESLKGK